MVKNFVSRMPRAKEHEDMAKKIVMKRKQFRLGTSYNKWVTKVTQVPKYNKIFISRKLLTVIVWWVKYYTFLKTNLLKRIVHDN